MHAISASSFRYVYIKGGKYKVKLDRSVERRYLGCFQTPEQAALRVARWLRDRASADLLAPATSAAAPFSAGADAAPPSHPMAPAADAVAATAAEGLTLLASVNETALAVARAVAGAAAAPLPHPMTAAEAVAAAAAEGLTLVRGNNSSGF